MKRLAYAEDELSQMTFPQIVFDENKRGNSEDDAAFQRGHTVQVKRENVSIIARAGR